MVWAKRIVGISALSLSCLRPYKEARVAPGRQGAWEAAGGDLRLESRVSNAGEGKELRFYYK